MFGKIAMIVALLILLLAATGYVITPLGWDQQICVGVAQQVDNNGSFPGSVVNTWNLRGIGHKLVTYWTFRSASAMVHSQDKAALEMVYRLVSLVVIVTFLALSVWCARKQLREWGISSLFCLFILLFAFFTESHWSALQAEDMTALMVVVAVGLGLGDRSWMHIVAGFLLALTVTPKGITLAMGCAGLIGVFLLSPEKKQAFRVAISFVLSGLLLAGIYLFVIPQEVIDLRQAALFQESFSVPFVRRVLILFMNGAASWPHIPILLTWGGCTIGIAIYLFLKKRFSCLAGVMGILLFSVAAPVCQARMFAYHLTALLPLAVGASLAAVFLLKQVRYGSLWVAMLIFAMIVSAGVSMTALPMGRYQNRDSSIFERIDSVQKQRAFYARLASRFALPGEPSLMYLSPGLDAYYFGSPTYLKYTYPLPLQRSGDVLIASDIRREVFAAVLKYDGDYVTWDTSWLKMENDLAPLHEFLMTNYECAFESDDGYLILQKKPLEYRASRDSLSGRDDVTSCREYGRLLQVNRKTLGPQTQLSSCGP